jgi:hypothetical protein
MQLEEALKIVTEQTIPALERSGGGGHAEALKVLVSAVGEPIPLASFDPGRWLAENVRTCAHGYVHISCGDCNNVSGR